MLYVVKQLEEEELAAPRGFKRGERHRQLEIGRIAGTRFFTEAPPAVEKINDHLVKITWALDLSTDDAALEFVSKLSEDDKLERSEEVRNWLENAEKYRSRISEYERFFSNNNLEIIHRWAKHPLFNLPTDIEVEGGRLVVQEKFEPISFSPMASLSSAIGR